jgi:sugar lactone lactonase YvrE
LVRKITPAGVVSTVVDSGYDQLGGIAVDAAGNIYVTSPNGVHRGMPDGSLVLVAGNSGSSGYADGTGAAARFRNPQGIVFDGNGNLLVADTNNRVIRQVTPAGVVTTLAGTPRQRGSTDGPGASAMFDVPVAITVDRAGRILVGDVGNHTLRVLSRSDGQVNVATLAGQAQSGLVVPGTGVDGAGSAARLMLPRGLAIDLDGNTIVADGSALRKVTPAGVVTTVAGMLMNLTPTDGTGSAAGFAWNSFGGTLWSDATGNVLLADNGSSTLRKITPSGTVTTIAGSFFAKGAVDGSGDTARFSRPSGIVGDPVGNLYVADAANYLIRKVAPDGTVSTLAGMTGATDTVDGTGTGARFSNMSGMTIDATGNLFLLDEQRSGQAVRKITPAGVVTTVKLLQNDYGYAEAIAIDATGNLYYADYSHSVIWKLAPDGTETVLAGVVDQTGSVDGTGAAARFNRPDGLTIDPAGNLYVLESYVGTIRKITPAGVVTTVAGVAGKSGPVSAAEPLPGHLPLGWALRYIGNNTLAVLGEGGLFKVVLP